MNSNIKWLFDLIRLTPKVIWKTENFSEFKLEYFCLISSRKFMCVLVLTISSSHSVSSNPRHTLRNSHYTDVYRYFHWLLGSSSHFASNWKGISKRPDLMLAKSSFFRAFIWMAFVSTFPHFHIVIHKW